MLAQEERIYLVELRIPSVPAFVKAEIMLHHWDAGQRTEGPLTTCPGPVFSGAWAYPPAPVRRFPRGDVDRPAR